jgi:uncharacterized protein YbjQ (UPF0145 family)
MGFFDYEPPKPSAAPSSPADRVIVATSNVPWDYEVVDAVFAIDSHQAGVFTSASPGTAFDGAKRQLREACLALGCDAVISCLFEYRVALGDGLFGKKQCIEIFAYGTAVKRR